MPGHLAIDFGTSNTVAALWDSDRAEGRSLSLGDLSVPDRHENHEFHSVPSLIHYDAAGQRVRVGRQLLGDGLLTHPNTFRWMKTYVANGMSLPRRIGERTVDFQQAAADFLGQVLLAVGAYADLANEDVAFTLPVEAFEHYQNWLDGIAEKAGVGIRRFIDEASAAALGYAAKLRTNDAFMVFDFGGGTADASIVRIEETGRGERRCRLLGKAGAQVGGSLIDQWIVRDLPARSGRGDGELRPLMPLLLAEAERVKKSLSAADAEEFTLMDPNTGAVLSHRYSRPALEDLLETNGLYTKLNTLLDLAENASIEHGYDKQVLRACLMIGGSSLIPSVRRLVRTRYGERVRFERPFDAVAVGAAAYVAGADFDDRVRHEYALRPYNRAKREYVFQTIVRAGTPYPCVIMDPRDHTKPLTLTIKASNDGQTRLGLQVYEVSHRESVACGGSGFDLVFDEQGGARYRKRDDPEDTTHRPIGSPTFITGDPPAKLGDPRFLATFSINGQKYICVTVKDTLVGKTLMRDYPMVKLT